MAEVAAHLSTCPHCKRGLKKRELQRSPVRADLRYTLSTALRRPRVVVVGWALAGIQAGVIIAFVVWTSMMPTRLPGFNVPMYNDVNQSQLQHTVQVLDIVQIELAAKAQMGDVIGLLERLDLQLAGPDSRDRFLLKKADGLYLSRRDVAVIEQLQAHPDLLRLILPSSDSSGEASGGR